jgi:hypothetical protein
MPDKKVPYGEAMSAVLKMIRESNIPGSRTRDDQMAADALGLGAGTRCYCEWRLAFAVQVTLSIRFELDLDSIQGGNMKTARINGCVDVSAPSVNTDITNAAAFGALFKRVTELGLMVNAYLEGIDIRHPIQEGKK